MKYQRESERVYSKYSKYSPANFLSADQAARSYFSLSLPHALIYLMLPFLLSPSKHMKNTVAPQWNLWCCCPAAAPLSTVSLPFPFYSHFPLSFSLLSTLCWPFIALVAALISLGGTCPLWAALVLITRQKLGPQCKSRAPWWLLVSCWLASWSSTPAGQKGGEVELSNWFPVG